MPDATSNGHRPAVRAPELWAAGRPAYGTVCAIPSPFVAELLVNAGFEWLCIDCQHGLISDQDMVSMLQAVGSAATTFVRVAWNRPELIMRALDAGADGVIVPMVNSAAEARAAAGACRYPPRGYRSFGPTRAALRVADFTPESANRRVLCAVMIETLEGAEHADEILGVEGVDAVWVGPWDLSLSASGGLEAPGQTALDVRLIQSVLESCRKNGVIPGISVGTAEQAQYWRDAGFTMMAAASDFRMLEAAAARLLDTARQTPGCESGAPEQGRIRGTPTPSAG
jgi:4-hydroxy-2-oxoheptanedioate aldolase